MTRGGDGDSDDEPTVKQLLDQAKPAGELDPATQAELARWFQLPSFEQLEDAPAAAPADAAATEARERRAQTLAAVDPAMVDAHEQRFATAVARMSLFRPSIDVRVDPSVALLDTRMIERQRASYAERPRELPPELEDDLRECTPQALLRDLHRPELEFEKQFEIVDTGPDPRFAAATAATEAMATRWKISPPERSPLAEARAEYDALRALRRSSWPAIVAAGKLPNRRVTE